MKALLNIVAIAIGLYVIFAAIDLLVDTPWSVYKGWVFSVGIFSGLGATGLYFLSHLLRIVRFSLLLNQSNLSFRKLAYVQLYSNGINLVLPFKVGEFWRMRLFNKVISDPSKTVITVIIERMIDFYLLFLILLGLFLFSPERLPHTVYFVSLSIVFLVGGAFLFVFIPENLNLIKIFLVKRANSNAWLRLIHGINKLESAICYAKRLVASRFATLWLLSFLIWGLEIAGVYCLFYPFLPEVGIIMLAVYIFLSGLLPSGPLGFGGVQLAFYWAAQIYKVADFMPASFVYQLYIFMPGLLLSAAMAAGKLVQGVPWRWQREPNINIFKGKQEQ